MTDYKNQIATLMKAQAKDEAELKPIVEKADELRAAEEPVPSDLKDRGVALSTAIAERGSKIDALKKEQRSALDNDNEFHALMQERKKTLDETVQRRDPLDLEDPDAGEVTLSRDTIAAIEDAVRDVAGSRGHKFRVNRKSEALVREYFETAPGARAAKREEWNARAAELSGWRDVKRTVLTTSDAAGGFLIPDDNTFMNQVQQADAAYGGVDRIARIVPTADGAPLPIPTSDGNIFLGELLAENTDAPDTSVTFGEERMRAFMYTSGRLSFSHQAYRDAGVNLPMLLGMFAGEAIMRAEALAFINGAGGTAAPEGLNTAYQEAAIGAAVINYDRSANRYTNAGASNDAFDAWFATFMRLKYTTDPAFRRSPQFAMVLGDNLDYGFASAQDAENRPLWPRWADGNSARGMGIDMGGMRILSDYSIPSVAARTTDGVVTEGWIGDFSKYWIRRIEGMLMADDPYTGAARLARRYSFFRACDARGLFKTAVAARAARSGTTPASVARSAAIERIQTTSKP